RSARESARGAHATCPVAGGGGDSRGPGPSPPGPLRTGRGAVRAAGPPAVPPCARHAGLSGPAVSRLAESAIDELMVTDTIPLGKEAAQLEKITVLPVAPLLAEAIRRTHDEASISSLFI